MTDNPLHDLQKKKISPLSRREPKDSLSPVDASSDFYDPFSDLNLFLAQKIKEEMAQHGPESKWSFSLQEKLIEKINPEFQKKFPNYRLGVTALKKTWEKVGYYLEHILSQKEALTPEGKLSLPFLIKENLRGQLYSKQNV